MFSAEAQDPSANFIATSGWLKENLQLYLEKYAQIDPVPALMMSLPAGTATCTNRLFSPEQLRTNRFYNDFFVPSGMAESLVGHLYSDQANFSLVAVMRGEDRKPFDDGDIARL